MNQFGELYSQYYDLLYKDKNYLEEVEYIESIIKNLKGEAKSILDLGCGTGRHAEILCDKGYIVHGIDISQDMIMKAQARQSGKEDRLSFSVSSIQNLSLNKRFDVIISLFHVMSYQTSNKDLISAFEVAKKHLNENGLFIFDFWYGPTVLREMPANRVKRLESKNIKVTRIAEPELHVLENIVDVNYTLFIENKDTKEFIEIKELHRMRYLFDTELEIICNIIGFKIINKYEWMTFKTPDIKSWNVIWIIQS